MTIITDVMSDVLTSVPSGVLDLNGTRARYTYNGTDMYATALPWTPLGALFSYGADVVVDTAAAGDTQIIVNGNTQAGLHRLYINPTGGIRVRYIDTVGGDQFISGATAEDSGSYNFDVKYYPDRVELWQAGSFVNSTLVAPELAELSYFAATLTPNLYFGGTISNIHFTSQSPMQNINAMGGNGTDRYASIPTFSPVAFTSSQWVRIDDQSFSIRIWGGDSNFVSRLFVGTNGSVNITDISATTISTSTNVIKEGQDHLIETEVLADGSCEIWIDGVSKASGIAGTFDGLAWDINSIHRQNTVYGAGLITNQVFQDLTTGITRTYNNVNDSEVLGEDLYSFANVGTSGAAVITNSGSGYTFDGTGVIGDNGERSYVNLTTVAGESHRVTLFYTGDIGGSPAIFVRDGVDGGGTVIATTPCVADTPITIDFIASGTTTNLLIDSSFPEGTYTVVVSVKQITLPLVDSTGGQDGVWINAVEADRVYLPKTDRLYRANEGEGDLLHNAYDPKRMKYHLDGVDQYFSIPSVSLENGDILSFKFIAPTSPLTVTENLTNHTSSGNALWSDITASNKIRFNAANRVYLDDVEITSNVDDMPSDGLIHTLRYDITSQRSLNIIGASSVEDFPASFPIYDIDINGERFYPVNDGSGDEIVDTLNPETELWNGSEATGVSVGGFTSFLDADIGTALDDLVLLTYDAAITSGGVNIVNFSGDTTVTATGSYSVLLTAAGGGNLVFQSSGAGFIGDITNVSVIEYTNGTIVNGDDAGWIDSSPTDATIVNEDDANWNRS